MKKNLLLLTLSLCFLGFGYNANAQEITIGTGQFVHSATNPWGPMDSRASDSLYNRNCHIYSGQFFSSMVSGDTIRSIGFNRSTNSNNAMSGMPSLKMWFNNTTEIDYGPGNINWKSRADSAVLVFDGDPSAYVTGASGYNIIPLDFPYGWNPALGGNFELIIEYQQVTAQGQDIIWLYDRADATPGFIDNQTKVVTGNIASISDSTSFSNLRHPNIKLIFPSPDNVGSGDMSSMSFIYIDEYVIPTVYFENTGQNEQLNVPVTATLPSGYSSTVIIDTMSINEVVIVEFDTLFAPSTAGTENMMVYTSLVGDGFAGDDTLIQAIEYYDPFPTPTTFLSGPLVNRPGAGLGGRDESDVVAPITLAGSNINHGSPFKIMDDFIVPDAGPLGQNWVIDSIVVMAYMTGSDSAVSPFTSGFFRILDGSPLDPGTTSLYGDTTSSALFDSYWSGVYRVFTTQAVNRPIMRNVLVPLLGTPPSLPSGKYWLECSLEGSASFSGPWAPYVTLDNHAVTGNALHRTSNFTTDPLGGGASLYGFDYQQGLVFEVYASINTSIDVLENLGFKIDQNVPNPFTDVTNITYHLDKAAEISIEILDIRGRSVSSKDLGKVGSGSHTERLDLSNNGDGMYFARFRVNGAQQTVKINKSR